jgi:hypothetical protein
MPPGKTHKNNQGSRDAQKRLNDAFVAHRGQAQACAIVARGARLIRNTINAPTMHKLPEIIVATV